jgi:1-deoxy-D-xylulose-5-phosphate reductoisomerase
MTMAETLPRSTTKKTADASQERRVVILGSTGSIGVNALGVVQRLGKPYRVVGLSARRNLTLLLDQIRQFQPEVVSVWDESDARSLRAKGLIVQGKPLKVLSGLDGLTELAAWPSADTVLSAVVGAVGLRPLMAAARAGKIIALANKEALIMAGELVVAEAKRWKATLLPVDSEHSALFQCLNGERLRDVRRLILTASGGPFYRYKKSLDRVTVKQALAHPTWKMGRKITIDSATLMNKGIEALEASILFGIPLERVDVVIHPQSIVHSLVEYVDSAMLAQLSWPDMCLPIQYALTYPVRMPGRLESLDLVKAQKLEFLKPDFHRFPCLALAREAGSKGGTWPTVLNASNETAVQAFLEEKIRFTGIAKVVEKTLNKHKGAAHPSLEAVLEADQWGRRQAGEFCHG